MLSIVHNDARWATFRGAVSSELLDDAKFQSVADRRTHAVALTAALDTIFATRPAAEWEKILDEHGVVFGAAHTVFDVTHDEQARICGALVLRARTALGDGDGDAAAQLRATAEKLGAPGLLLGTT